MLEAFKAFIKKNELITEDDQLLLTVSGGVDSVVLAQLCKMAGFSFGIAHVNFQLRAEESDADALLVEELATVLDCPFHIKQVDTKELAKERNESIQLTARHIRYEWFHQLCHSFGYTKIVTAHHLNDSLETVLYNLSKGTGLAGLQGVPMHNNSVIRPLLFASKSQITAFAKEQSLVWREDASNLKTDYSRNLIRLEVIPLLKQINPSLESTFQHSLERFQMANELVQEKLAQLKSSAIHESDSVVRISKGPFLEKKSGLLLLSMVIEPYGFNYLQLKQFIEKTDTIGARLENEQYCLVNDRTEWIITKNKNEFTDAITITPEQGSIEFGTHKLSWNKVTSSTDFQSLPPTEVMIDANLLKWPVTLRKVKTADWFIPLGMKGKKKLSDFMIDKKIPLNLKKKVMVLTSNEDIVWVIGHRLDERFKVSDTTDNILHFRIENI